MSDQISKYSVTQSRCYMSGCVCIYTCTHVYTHVHTDTHTHTHIYAVTSIMMVIYD